MTQIIKPISIVGILFLVAFSFFMVFSSLEVASPSFNTSSIATEKFFVQEWDYAQEARIIEVVSGHAWQGHGTEVNDAMRCLNNNGSTMSFKTSGFMDRNGKSIPTNLWLCKNGDDWYAIVTTVFEKVGGNKVARLVTAYKVSKDIFPTIEIYIEHIVSKWGAIAINYSIQAGDILLQPK